MDCLGCSGAAELHHTYCLSLLARPSRRGSTKAHTLRTPIKKELINRSARRGPRSAWLGCCVRCSVRGEWQTRARSLMRWQQRRASGSRRVAAIAAAGATFKSLGDLWCDTTTPHRWLMLTVLDGFAEFERHLILARTSEGRARTRARGVRFGRKLKLTVHQRQEALARRAGERPWSILRGTTR
jgi:hypothetical protein